MARRELSTAIVDNTILTVIHRDDGEYVLEVEYPNGDIMKTGSLDVRDVFTRMGQEVRFLLHLEKDAAERLAEEA